MAALGYEETNENLIKTIKYRCAGGLISKKWVLTASHCLKNGLKKVRVGALSLTKTSGAEKPQEINIKSFKNHPEHTSLFKYNDIALLELESKVDTSTGYVRPLCLPAVQSQQSENKYIIAGWGFVDQKKVSF